MRRKAAAAGCHPRVLLVNTTAARAVSPFSPRKRPRRPSISGSRLACKTQGGSCGSLLRHGGYLACHFACLPYFLAVDQQLLEREIGATVGVEVCMGAGTAVWSSSHDSLIVHAWWVAQQQACTLHTTLQQGRNHAKIGLLARFHQLSNGRAENWSRWCCRGPTHPVHPTGQPTTTGDGLCIDLYCKSSSSHHGKLDIEDIAGPQFPPSKNRPDCDID